MDRSVLRLEIDGQWEPQDFEEVFKSIESLYYKALPRPYGYRELDFRFMKRPFGSGRFGRELDDMNDWLLENARRSAVEDRILIARVQYASPGEIDFAGLGKSMESLERLLARLIALVTERNLRKAADEQAAIKTAEMRETLRAKQIENTRNALQLWHDFPDHMGVLLPLADRDQEKLVSRISQGKLKGVRLVSSNAAKRSGGS